MLIYFLLSVLQHDEMFGMQSYLCHWFVMDIPYEHISKDSAALQKILCLVYF